MSIQKVLKMAENFLALAEDPTETVVLAPPVNEYQEQRNRLAKFEEALEKKLRLVIAEMGNDLSTLRFRNFDPKTFKIFGNIYQTLIDIMKSIDPQKPYIAAEKLVRLVSERSTRIILENLDYIAKHHVETTNVDFRPSSRLKHPEIRSIDALRTLAADLKKFMDEHPLINPPGQSAPPAARLPETVKELPAFSAGQGDKTNPAVPLAKK